MARYRPQLDIDAIATGEVWLGLAAQEKLLVDELKTSDQYLAEHLASHDLYHLHFATRKSLQERVGLAASVALDRFALTWIGRLTQQRFW